GLSRETQGLIFGERAFDEGRSAPRGSTGEPARDDNAKTGNRTMLYSERIESAQKEVVTLQDQLASLPDAEDVARVSDLTARIGEVKNKIFAWTEAEKALGENAPITVPKDRITVYSPAQPLPASAPKA